jgi:hypothetical protein
MFPLTVDRWQLQTFSGLFSDLACDTASMTPEKPEEPQPSQMALDHVGGTLQAISDEQYQGSCNHDSCMDKA